MSDTLARSGFIGLVFALAVQNGDGYVLHGVFLCGVIAVH